MKRGILILDELVGAAKRIAARAKLENEPPRRVRLMDAAVRAYRESGPTERLPGGVDWWPELAPLTRYERDVVRRTA